MREKLIELIEQVYFCSIEMLADHLIANGVTVLDCDRDCKSCWKTQLVTPKWIPVSERLPKPYSYVLVYGQGGVSFGYMPTNIKWKGVTHWMPLPEPPKGD